MPRSHEKSVIIEIMTVANRELLSEGSNVGFAIFSPPPSVVALLGAAVGVNVLTLVGLPSGVADEPVVQVGSSAKQTSACATGAYTPAALAAGAATMSEAVRNRFISLWRLHRAGRVPHSRTHRSHLTRNLLHGSDVFARRLYTVERGQVSRGVWIRIRLCEHEFCIVERCLALCHLGKRHLDLRGKLA